MTLVLPPTAYECFLTGRFSFGYVPAPGLELLSRVYVIWHVFSHPCLELHRGGKVIRSPPPRRPHTRGDLACSLTLVPGAFLRGLSFLGVCPSKEASDVGRFGMFGPPRLEFYRGRNVIHSSPVRRRRHKSYTGRLGMFSPSRAWSFTERGGIASVPPN